MRVATIDDSARRQAAAHKADHELPPPVRLSRRGFIGGVAVAAGAAYAFRAVPAAALAGRPSLPVPAPIPGGFNLADFGGPDLLLHVFPPAPGFELATVTDFNGLIGAAEVQGLGTDGDGATKAFDVDMRFFQGEYVGADGRHAVTTFGFI